MADHPVVDLGHIEQRYLLREYEQRITLGEIKKKQLLEEIKLRRLVAWVLMGLFLALNVLLAMVLWWTISFDHEVARQILSAAAKAGQPPPTMPEPVVTHGVVMALIAGTIAQVGAAALVITRYLFSS